LGSPCRTPETPHFRDWPVPLWGPCTISGRDRPTRSLLPYLYLPPYLLSRITIEIIIIEVTARSRYILASALPILTGCYHCSIPLRARGGPFRLLLLLRRFAISRQRSQTHLLLTTVTMYSLGTDAAHCCSLDILSAIWPHGNADRELPSPHPRVALQPLSRACLPSTASAA